MLNNPTAQGTIAAVLANFLFSVLFLFGLILQPLSGTQVAAWRIIMMLISLVVLITLSKQWLAVCTYLKTLKTVQDWLLFILPTPILGAQIWLFMWGPVNGLGLDVTLGYFLYPLVMIVIGRVFYHETMSRLQWLATGCAALGIGYDVWLFGQISWATLFVCLGYPPYYLMRRKLAVPPITGLLSDLILLLPVVIFILLQSGGVTLVETAPKLWYLLPLLGVLSTAAMSLTMVASNKLPVSLFGTLCYLEPIFLFVFSITLLHQSVSEGGSVIMFGLIFVALMIMVIDSALGYWARRRENRLQGYGELQVATFPTTKRFKKRRVKSLLRVRRFRKLQKERQRPTAKIQR
ncbi:EamA family transporter RarD [Psychrobacter ciconiae]|uniref:EamA family transporter RarD n=1 Tax=Psychrobacter ciconiae TaxID=1553449 RepID=UPI001917CC73|nr:EamA family transporter RarD [Psychrobacter ciconiae]